MYHGCSQLSQTILQLLLFAAVLIAVTKISGEDKRSYIRELVEKNIHKVGHLLLKGVPTAYLNSRKAEPKPKDDLQTEKAQYAAQAKTMFYHAYNSYMMYAFPADELMPISCKGRVRGLTASRGEVDDALGRYMLTLVDTLDTLLVINDHQGFEYAVKMVIRGISFDTDITVNLFEANIRILGGLLGGHAGCLYLNSIGKATWYSNELLLLAVDLANRFLPAFDTPTGLPIPKINLRHGVYGIKDNETCTACAGSLYLEFAALSRYTGNSSYENVARVALDYLYNNRVPGSDLPGSVININKGGWSRKESTVGAGIDSYYEYLLKGYILTGDGTLWEMFKTQYNAVRKHLMRGNHMITVHSVTPHNRLRDYQDALQAFWPGVQVLAGDLDESFGVYEHYSKVAALHKYTLPEAFLLDKRVFWPQYYIRPELIESTYLLYKATKDPKYIKIGAKIMQAIENRCRVVCGYAGLKNVATGELEDRLDSFVLSETFKYLYLLFAEDKDLGIPIDDYILTTEAHIIPLSLQMDNEDKVNGTLDVCPNMGITQRTWLEQEIIVRYFTVKHANVCVPDDAPFDPRKKVTTPRASGPRTITAALRVETFDHSNPEHISILRSMGISLESVEDQKLQLVHNSAKAFSEQLGIEGVIFMKEIMDYSKSVQEEGKTHIGTTELFVQSLLRNRKKTFEAGKAMFGPELTLTYRVSGTAVLVEPDDGCAYIANNIRGRVALIRRGGCMFIEKVRIAQIFGAIGVVIMDHMSGPGGALAMSSDGFDNIKIPSLFLHKDDGDELIKLYEDDPNMLIVELRAPSIPPSEQKCGS